MSSYISQRKFDLALAAAEKGCLLNPDYYQQFIGQVLLYKGDFSGAQKVFQEVCEKKRMGSKNVLWCLALIRGHYKEGLTLLQKNIEGSKGNTADEADANRNLALGLEKAGRYEEAYRAFNQSLKLSAEDRKSAGEFGVPYLPSEQGSDLFAKGRMQAEMKSLDQAQRTAGELGALIDHGINKEDRQAQEYLLGHIEFENKNYQKAADFFGKACSRLSFEGGYWGEIGEGAHAPFLERLARAYYESGNLDKSRENYEKITLLTTGRFDHGDLYAKAYYMLGKIAEQQGDKARARQNYTKFLDLWKDADPGLPEVEDARKRLAGL
jgi:tetratricopeptide (TPR) repeat protein